jgi:hypothetical protein
MNATNPPHTPENDALADVDPSDPYLPLDAHVISVKALYCEDGCGLVETSGYGDDQDAAEELDKRGWAVRPHSLGGLTSLCKDCVADFDTHYAEDNAPIPPEVTA